MAALVPLRGCILFFKVALRAAPRAPGKPAVCNYMKKEKENRQAVCPKQKHV